MTFTSYFFLIGLLPWFLLVCYLSRKLTCSKKLLIFLANSIFYLWGGILAFLFLCLFSFISWIFGTILQKKRSKALLFTMICIMALPLFLVKYTGFITDNVNLLFHCSLPISQFVMPIGISFFTFEALSFLCDAYSGKIKGKVTPGDLFLYLSFFPTVTSGPIIRFSDFKSGLQKQFDFDHYGPAIERFVVGLCKKVLVADKIAYLANYYFDGVALGNTYSCAGLWIGSITYTLQLYFDFSGYSDMAIGIGELLGFRITENFNKPYCAGSITDFWRRWHISLSQWFRDYIYIPLGGNRCTVSKHICNLFVVWILTGIWHGADWTFLLWGLGYFVLVTIEKYIPAMKKIGEHWYGHFYALFFINLLWIPFRAKDLFVTGNYLSGMFGANGLIGLEKKAITSLPYLTIAILLCCPWENLLQRFHDKLWYKITKGLLLIIFTCIAVCAVINSSYAPYIYGDF